MLRRPKDSTIEVVAPKEEEGLCSLSYPAHKAHAPVIISSVACHALQYFYTYLINCIILGKKKLLNIKICFFLHNF